MGRIESIGSERESATTNSTNAFDLLSKRDSCADAFGNGWINSICAPGKTLCCVNERQSYPQCYQGLGLGWCCTESEKGCYVDLESSSCGQPGAVQCSELAQGVEEACCPQFTTCAEGYNASSTWVRCDIQETALKALALSTNSISGARTKTQAETYSDAVQSQSQTQPASSPSASSSSSSSSSSSREHTSSTSTIDSTTSMVPKTPGLANSTLSTSSPTGSAPGLPQTTLSTSTTKNLSTVAIAGIAIGPVVAVLLGATGIWLLWRRRLKTKLRWALTQRQEHQAPPESDAKSHEQGSNSSWGGFHGFHELQDNPNIRELPDKQTSPREVQGRGGWAKAGRVEVSPVELEGSLQ